MKLNLTLVLLFISITAQAQLKHLKGRYETVDTSFNAETQYFSIKKGEYAYILSTQHKYVVWRGVYRMTGDTIVRRDDLIAYKKKKPSKRKRRFLDNSATQTDSVFIHLNKEIDKVTGWVIINDTTILTLGKQGEPLYKQRKKRKKKGQF